MSDSLATELSAAEQMFDKLEVELRTKLSAVESARKTLFGTNGDEEHADPNGVYDDQGRKWIPARTFNRKSDGKEVTIPGHWRKPRGAATPR